MNIALDNGCVPIDVGVAGHRNLLPEQLPAIETAISNFFDMLRRNYPTTPLRCYTALAIGADQLVAKIALTFGAELIVVLPEQKQVYVEHFFDNGILGDFESLYRGASRTITLPRPRDLTEQEYAGPAHKSNRERQFASLGDFFPIGR